MHTRPLDELPFRPGPGEGRRLLYVKDGILGAPTCPPAFRRTGWRVLVVPSCGDAYDRLGDCDLLLLELGPRPDPVLALIDHVRQHLQLDRLPLIVLRVGSDAASATRCRAMESSCFRFFAGGSPMRVVDEALRMLDPTYHWTPPTPPEGIIFHAQTETPFHRPSRCTTKLLPLTGLTFGQADENAA